MEIAFVGTRENKVTIMLYQWQTDGNLNLLQNGYKLYACAFENFNNAYSLALLFLS